MPVRTCLEGVLETRRQNVIDVAELFSGSKQVLAIPVDDLIHKPLRLYQALLQLNGLAGHPNDQSWLRPILSTAGVNIAKITDQLSRGGLNTPEIL